jgi:hypothetical protein
VASIYLASGIVRATAKPFAPAGTIQQYEKARRRGHGRGFGINSTADVLLTKSPMFVSETFHFYGICRENREPTSGLEPLTPAHYE